MDELRNDMAGSASGKARRRNDALRMRVGACLVEADLDRIVGPAGETSLEPKSMAVLMHLVRHAGCVVSTSELVEVVWLGRPMGDNPVYRCIAQLRRALGDDARSPRYIATVPTKGYRLIAPVQPVPAVAPLAAPIPPPSGPDEPAGVLSQSRSPGRPRVSLRRVGWLLLLGLLPLAVVLALVERHGRPAAGARPPMPPTLAVLPLQVAGGQDRLLAQSVTGLLRERLARNPHLRVVASDTPAADADDVDDVLATAARLHAAYLLTGQVSEAGGRLRAELRLLEAASGRVRWSSRFDRPLGQLAGVREEAATRVAQVLGASTGAAPAVGPVMLDAYRIYTRGRQQLARQDAADVADAVELFRRATILDPAFARAYLGLGQALLWQLESDAGPAPAKREEASRAIDRALALDPGMGEGWVARARLASDPARADALYRKGLALAPSDGSGYARYAESLFATSRVGEAIQTLEQARRLDPLDPLLCLTQAFLVMVVRSDVAEHDRLVRQALAIDPQFPAALYQLAYSKWEYSGAFAQAAQLAEQAIAVEPGSLRFRLLARDIYLDLGDPARAEAVLGPDAPADARVELAQYRGDMAAAARLLKALPASEWPDLGPQASKAQALRDAALANGQFAGAMQRLQAIQVAHRDRMPMWYRGYALVQAHTLVLAGRVAEGRRLAQATLALVDAHGLGRPPHWFSRERAAAFAVLGDDRDALRELSYSVRNGQLYRWWYLAGHDPLYAHLRDNPRFRALDRMAQAHIERERRRHAAGSGSGVPGASSVDPARGLRTGL